MATGCPGGPNSDTYCPAVAHVCRKVVDGLKNERTNQKGAPLKRTYTQALEEAASLTGVSVSTLRRMESRVDHESGAVTEAQPKGNFTAKSGIENTWALGRNKDGSHTTVADVRLATEVFLINCEAVGRITLRKDVRVFWTREFGIDATDDQVGSCLRRWGFSFREQLSKDKIKRGSASWTSGYSKTWSGTTPT